jgi:tetraacyldisaccharide 4'-kinase
VSWIDARDESLARRAWLLPLAPLGQLWSLGASLHRWVYDVGLLPRRRLPCRVLSVGSLLAGGAGKTPAAAWLAVGLARRGRRAVLASRGYRRGDRRGPRVVSDGRVLRGRVETAGDEPLVLAARAPGVPVLVDRDRARLGWRALAGFDAQVLVLDDGFQHHRLERDLDVLLLDGGLGLGNRRCLPRGPLREPLAALRRAHALGGVDGPLPAEDQALLAQLAPGAFRFAARRRALALRPLGGGARESPERLRGRRVGMLCGLAHPASLRRTLEGLGAQVVAERTFRDHHVYRRTHLRGLADEAPLWITTEKDAVKLQRPWAGDADVRVLGIGLEVEEPERLLCWLEERLG